MPDKYSDFANSSLGKQVTGRLGLPRPTVLRRFHPGQAIAPGPVFVGAVGPTSDLEAVLKRAGVAEVVTREGEGGKLGAIVVDATGAVDPTDLHAVYAALSANLRALLPSARVVVVGRKAGDDDEPAVAATRQAVDGLVRSLAKELRAEVSVFDMTSKGSIHQLVSTATARSKLTAGLMKDIVNGVA